MMAQSRLIALYCIFVSLSWFGGVSRAGGDDAAGVKPIVSWSGTDSYIAKPRIQRISSRKEWIAVWLEHQGKGGDAKTYDNLHWKNDAKVPDVDFATHMVIAIFEGKTVNCAGFTNASWNATAEGIDFRFDLEFYGTIGQEDKVTPFGLYVIPRSDKGISLQIPKQGPTKDAPPTGKWETYGRILKLEKGGS